MWLTPARFRMWLEAAFYTGIKIECHLRITQLGVRRYKPVYYVWVWEYIILKRFPNWNLVISLYYGGVVSSVSRRLVELVSQVPIGL